MKQKVISYLLVFCLLFSLAVPAFAEGETDFTVFYKTPSGDEGSFALNADSINAMLSQEKGTEFEITLNRDTTVSLAFPSGGIFKLNLNGNTLMGAEKDTIYVETDAKLEIKGDGKVVASKTSYAAVFNNGTTTLLGGHYTRSQPGTGKNQWYVICNHGSMEINAGVKADNAADGNSSLIENGYSNYTASNERSGYVEGVNSPEPTMVINGGEFVTSGLNAVKNDDGGNLTIKDGTFAGSHDSGAVIMNWNVAAIEGGTFTASGQAAAVLSNGGYGANTTDKGSLVITDGEFIVTEDAVNTYLFSSGGSSGAGKTESKVDIKGGEFAGNFAKNLMDADYELTIAAGEFTSAVAVDYAADTSVAASLDSAGKTYVGTSAQVNGMLNQNAQKGDTVTIQKAGTGSVEIPYGVTVKNESGEKVTVNGKPVNPGASVVTKRPAAAGGVYEATVNGSSASSTAATMIAKGEEITLEANFVGGTWSWDEGILKGNLSDMDRKLVLTGMNPGTTTVTFEWQGQKISRVITVKAASSNGGNQVTNNPQTGDSLLAFLLK